MIAAEVAAGAATGSRSHTGTSTARAVERGNLTGDGAVELLDRITNTTTSPADLAEVGLVVETIPGHLDLNPLLFGYLNHAARVYESHYASREHLAIAMRFGCGYPVGSLALLDLIGLDR
ncbi:MAG: 3-hydroxyacyl-CoA dehydrogenase family protein [Pseudonocardia sp.]